MRLRAGLAIAAVVAATVTMAAPAGAEDVDIEDAAGDVVTAESETSISEPRVDITNVHVTHEARLLSVSVTVGQFVPLDDPVWLEGQLQVQVALADPNTEDLFGGFWIWDIFPDGDGGATGLLLGFSEDLQSCETEATADETTRTYTLSAGPECLRDVPRAVNVAAAAALDTQPNNSEFFDYPTDQAPDDELSDPIGSTGAPAVSRLAGQDRVETAIALSTDRFDDGEATVAVLASSADFPDAIAGGPLAAHHNAPLFLTGPDALDPRIVTELERAIAPGADVYLLGGTSVIGESVSAEVRALGYRPKRIGGANRFETAVAVADEIGEHALTIIADGRSFRDGLIAGAAAASLGGVVVLSDGATMPQATDDFLAADPTRHVAIGVAAQGAPGAERITAASAPELSQKVLDRLLPNATAIAVAGARTFADALAGAPHIAALGGGLLLTESDALAAPVRAELTQRKSEVREVVLYGGTASIPASVADAVMAAVS